MHDDADVPTPIAPARIPSCTIDMIWPTSSAVAGSSVLARCFRT